MEDNAGDREGYLLDVSTKTAGVGVFLPGNFILYMTPDVLFTGKGATTRRVVCGAEGSGDVGQAAAEVEEVFANSEASASPCPAEVRVVGDT